MQTRGLKKYIFLIAGCLSLTAGVIGIFLPLLPTTPFLLLAAYCFARSSNRLHNWLIGHKVFGSYINNYLIHRAIERKAKVMALIFMWGTMALSLLCLPGFYSRLLLVAIGLGVTIYLLSLKTVNNTRQPGCGEKEVKAERKYK